MKERKKVQEEEVLMMESLARGRKIQSEAPSVAAVGFETYQKETNDPNDECSTSPILSCR